MNSPEELRRIIDQHQVVYVHYAAKVVDDGELRVVGHDVSLFGTHDDHPRVMATPGCHKCSHVWQDLKLVAETILPPLAERTRVRIAPFSGIVHHAKERHERPDIELLLEIRHRSGYTAPVDDCEDACLAHVLGELHRLGVPERKWSGSPASA